MKRPFAGLCVLFLLFLAAAQAARPSAPDLLTTQNQLLEWCGDERTITASGIVTECRTISSGVRLFLNHISVSAKEKPEFSFLPDEKLTFTIRDTTVRPGDFVRVRGTCTFFEPAANPGQFDMQAYYFSENTVCMLKRAELTELKTGRGSPGRFLEEIRRTLSDSYGRILDEQTAGAIAAISLGEKGGLDQEWKDLYQEGGIAHILAISGLHVSLIGMGLYRLLRRSGRSFLISSLLSGMTVLLYACMTGFGISSVRAALMFLVWLGAQLCGRKYDMLTAASLAAVLLAGTDPAVLQQASFLLSFSAVLALAVLVPRLQELTGNSVCRAFLSCIGVWIGTLPVTLFFFFQAAPWSILVNLAVLPLMSVIMVSGLGAAAVGLVSVPAGTFLAAPVFYLLRLFEALCGLQQKLPCAVWVAGRPSAVRIVLYYAMLLTAAALTCHPERRPGFRKALGESRKRRCVVWGLCFGVCVLLMCPSPPAKLSVTCLDVGQGDSSLLYFPDGTSCLIDGGSTSQSSLWRYRIGQSVKYYGIRTLDYIFLSHADRDHISGVAEYLQDYAPGFAGTNAHGITLRRLVLPPTADPQDFEELRKLAAQKGIEVLMMQQESRIGREQGKTAWSMTCLSPDGDALTGDRNEDSMVLLLRYGAFRMLFTGDLEGGAERILAQQGDSLRADVLKVGHHGSGNGSSEEFLKQVSAQFAVISCGKDNSYGHPAQETLKRLEEAGCRIAVTMTDGAVTVTTDGETFSTQIYREES